MRQYFSVHDFNFKATDEKVYTPKLCMLSNDALHL